MVAKHYLFIYVYIAFIKLRSYNNIQFSHGLASKLITYFIIQTVTNASVVSKVYTSS